MRPGLRKVLYLLGGLAAIAGSGWALYLLWQQADGTGWLEFLAAHWLLLIGLVALQLLASSLMALSWGALLPGLGARTVPRGIDVRAQATSQAAKYIPGNVAHFAARHALGRDSGLSHSGMLRATIAETLSLLLAALLIAALSGLAGQFLLSQGPGHIWALLPVLIGVGLLIWQQRSGAHIRAFWVGMAFLGHLSLFALIGLSLWILVGLVTPAPVSIIGIAALAWMLGFLTPGAPGGLGVREAAMITLLGLSLPGSDWALIALLHRALTIFGDLLLAGLALNWQPPSEQDEQA